MTGLSVMSEMTGFDVEDFPLGCRVKLPTGRTGVVVNHKGYESKRDPFMRVMVRIDGGDRQDLVQLQPSMLTHFKEGEDQIQSWVGDPLSIGDVVSLPSKRLATVLAIAFTARRGASLGVITARIHSDDESDVVELPAHLVRKVSAQAHETVETGAVKPKKGRPSIDIEECKKSMLHAIDRLGFNPLAFPVWCRTAPVKEHKQAVAKHLGWSANRFQRIWQLLAAEGRIVESDIAAHQVTPTNDVEVIEQASETPETNEEKVLQAISLMGHNPKAFRAAKGARNARHQRSVRAATGLTRRQFDQAWRQLCRDGQIIEKYSHGSARVRHA